LNFGLYFLFLVIAGLDPAIQGHGLRCNRQGTAPGPPKTPFGSSLGVT
jgi:hypothetical protein